MPAPSQPALLPQPFANNATGSYRNTIPDTTGIPGQASYSLGFPPLTMTPIIAGGVPPLGQDVNGVLYAISSHTYYAQTGRPYVFNATLATAMGGYAIGTLLGMADGSGLWQNTVDGNTTDPDGGSSAGWIPALSYGIQAITVTGGTMSLSVAEAKRNIIVFSGVLVANQVVNFPTTFRRWLVVNLTTGSFTLTVKTPAGTGVIIPQGGYNNPVEVYGNGTSIFPAVAPVTIPMDQSPTPLTIVQRTSAGEVLATKFNQSSAIESFTITAVFAQQAADGYLRKISLAELLGQSNIALLAGTVTNAQVPVGAVNQHRATILNDSTLTGTPTAPTPTQGDDSSRLATTAFVQMSAVGTSGQTWQDLTASRSAFVTYTNTTGRPIYIAIVMSFVSGSFDLVVNGVGVGTCAGSNFTDTLYAIVPAGGTYSVQWSGSPTGLYWAELR